VTGGRAGAAAEAAPPPEWRPAQRSLADGGKVRIRPPPPSAQSLRGSWGSAKKDRGGPPRRPPAGRGGVVVCVVYNA
jgi:hypothetical protein